MVNNMNKTHNISLHFDTNNNTAPAVKNIHLTSNVIFHHTIKRFCCPMWTLDYSWTPTWKFRVGSSRNPWQFRKANIAHLYPPGTVLWEDYPDTKSTIIGISIHFTKGEAAGLNKLIWPKTQYARFHDLDGKLGEIFYQLPKIHQIFDDNCFPSAQSIMWNAFQMLLSSQHIENENYHITNPQTSPQQTFTTKVENYMRENYRKKITIDSLADIFNVSSNTLLRRFQREGKTSPMARLNEIRIDSAKTMLINGQKICHIANQIGFYDEFHLSKTFKKITGHSPRGFIKKIQKENA